MSRSLQLPADGVRLDADLVVPAGARGVVAFAHGSGSSRHSPRNRQVAEVLNGAGMATLLLDLLTAEEERIDERTRGLRFDIPLLAQRMVAACAWLADDAETAALPAGLFGASTGAAAALIAAARDPERVHAVVSRGGRPDLAGDELARVSAPTLLIVGGNDPQVLQLNREAAARLPGDPAPEIVAGASHLFTEPGALEQVADLAAAWFARHLPAA